MSDSGLSIPSQRSSALKGLATQETKGLNTAEVVTGGSPFGELGARAPRDPYSRRSKGHPKLNRLLDIQKSPTPASRALTFWRRGRDLNPRNHIVAKRFSRPPHSAALPPLQRYKSGATGAPRKTLAESRGFEPRRRFRRLHDFQSCAFDHSANSPIKCVD